MITARCELVSDGPYFVLKALHTPLHTPSGIGSRHRLPRASQVDDLGETRALPVARLSDEDLVAERLLANEERPWDDSTLGRDAMVLLVLEHALGGCPAGASDKARAAYRPSVESA